MKAALAETRSIDRSRERERERERIRLHHQLSLANFPTTALALGSAYNLSWLENSRQNNFLKLYTTHFGVFHSIGVGHCELDKISPKVYACICKVFSFKFWIVAEGHLVPMNGILNVFDLNLIWKLSCFEREIKM
jgi:hypothetical protein